MPTASERSTNVVLLYVTCRDPEEARSISEALLKSRLAACTNTLPCMTSTYWWNDAIETSIEAVMLVKTTSELSVRARELIVSLHSYDVPCVLEFPVAAGHADFLAYITQNCLPAASTQMEKL